MNESKMETRRFNGVLAGDRVARKLGSLTEPATDWYEAVLYAHRRAAQSGLRQTLRQHRNHGWWVCIQSTTPITRRISTEEVTC